VDNLYKINGPGVKGYVWLLIRQEELARSTIGPRLDVSDAELAKAIGVSKATAQTYRKILSKLKLIEVKERIVNKIEQISITGAKY
jgi:Mn-dependent DtxR family transcriptional regulator